MQTSEPCCCRCRFYDASEKAEDNVGLCRRYPPKPSGSLHVFPDEAGSRHIGAFPVVDMEDWCGEFNARG